MKLLHCLACGHLQSLALDERRCACGASAGRYVDSLWVEYRGPARVLGMRNGELMASLTDHHVPYLGPHYRWWVILEGEHIRRTDAGERSPEGAQRSPDALVPDGLEVLFRLTRLRAAALEVWEDRARVDEWIASVQPALGERRPAELAAEGEAGLERALRVLGAPGHGLPS